jgi:hypothetical protein
MEKHKFIENYFKNDFYTFYTINMNINLQKINIIINFIINNNIKISILGSKIINNLELIENILIKSWIKNQVTNYNNFIMGNLVLFETNKLYLNSIDSLKIIMKRFKINDQIEEVKDINKYYKSMLNTIIYQKIIYYFKKYNKYFETEIKNYLLNNMINKNIIDLNIKNFIKCNFNFEYSEISPEYKFIMNFIVPKINIKLELLIFSIKKECNIIKQKYDLNNKKNIALLNDNIENCYIKTKIESCNSFINTFDEYFNKWIIELKILTTTYNYQIIGLDYDYSTNKLIIINIPINNIDNYKKEFDHIISQKNTYYNMYFNYINNII